jgi:hypothetical protein
MPHYTPWFWGRYDSQTESDSIFGANFALAPLVFYRLDRGDSEGIFRQSLEE